MSSSHVLRRTAELAMLSSLVWLGGCSTATGRQGDHATVVSRLTIGQAREIAAARARANGFAVQATAPWTLALQVRDEGYLWVAHLSTADGPSPYWLHIDDVTGHAEFVMPIIKGGQTFAENADWLLKIDEGIKQTVFPIELEEFMREAHLAGATPTGGGSTEAGRFYLEYTLRSEKDTPARFEIRCYYTMPAGAAGPKMATGAELAYWDAKIYRYRLVRDAN